MRKNSHTTILKNGGVRLIIGFILGILGSLIGSYLAENQAKQEEKTVTPGSETNRSSRGNGINAKVNYTGKLLSWSTEDQTFWQDPNKTRLSYIKRIISAEIKPEKTIKIMLSLTVTGIIDKDTAGNEKVSIYFYVDDQLHHGTCGKCNDVWKPEIRASLTETVTLTPGKHQIKLVIWFEGEIDDRKLVIVPKLLEFSD